MHVWVLASAAVPAVECRHHWDTGASLERASGLCEINLSEVLKTKLSRHDIASACLNDEQIANS
jgi:hypothetical protein